VIIALAVVLVPYLFSRLASPWRRVSVHHLDDAAAGATNASDMLRIVTYNIAHGRGLADDNWRGGTPDERLARLEQIAELLKTLNAEIVVLNEVDFDCSWSGGVNQAEQIAKLAGYPHWVEARNLDFRVLVWTWRFGNAVLSRYPIASARDVPLPSEVGWETFLAGKKRSVICEIDPPSGRVRIIATHLSHRSESVRAASAKIISVLVDDSKDPIIVAGDLNSTPPGFPHSNADGQNAIALLDATGKFRRFPMTPPDESAMTYPSIRGRSVIDWILIPASWRFREYRVIASELSDHRPIVAEVETVRE
jgi:endonuclease/exonuclease/phosphatase family metal-dependent hydrolase